MSCSTCRYSFFLPSYTTLFKCYRLTSYMMSNNLPLNFSSTCFSLGDLSCRYNPVTSKVLTSCPFYAYITIVMNRDSKDTVVDEIISPYFRYLFCLLPLAHDLSFTLLYSFNFIKFIASNVFKYLVKRSESLGITKGFLVLPLYIAV